MIRTAFLVMLVILGSTAAAVEPAKDSAPPKIIGAWVNRSHADDVIAFEPQRCLNLDHGTIIYCPAVYEDGKVVLGYEREMTIVYRWQGEDLVAMRGGHDTHYQRLDALPKELTPPTVAIAAPAAVSAARM
nr:hypothetical protein [Planctomycetota bacterium]